MRHKTLNRIILGWILLVIFVALFGKVSLAASDAGRTAADFLLIGLGAKASAMGNAYTAVSNDALASYWNPAGLAEIEGGEVALGHFSWLQDITLEHGSVAYQVSEKATLGFSVTYLNYGDIEGYDDNGPTGELSAYDFCSAVSVGVKTGYNLSFGFTGKVINQKLDDLSATAFAVDVGAKYRAQLFQVAAVLANVGADMGFEGIKERLPMVARFGVVFFPFDERLTASFEIDKNIYGGTVYRNGYEFNFSEQYFLRTGYSFYPSQNRSLGQGVSFGGGIRLSWGEINYAFTPKEQYSSETLHRLSVIFAFGK